MRYNTVYKYVSKEFCGILFIIVSCQQVEFGRHKLDSLKKNYLFLIFNSCNVYKIL